MESLIQVPVYPVGKVPHELAELLVLDPLWDNLELITAISSHRPVNTHYLGCVKRGENRYE
jgi:hypothetical protein